ncbi:MAG: RNA methyltransferase [Salinivirgaceae bacterium]
MLSINQIKFIKSLEHKKYRKTHQCFVVEGEKIVLELMHSSFEIIDVFAIQPFIHNYCKGNNYSFKINEITDSDLNKISFLQTPNQVLAVARLPMLKPIELSQTELMLALDNIQDPGNLGTIIRTAGWFGISQLFCSPETVDAFNPKVVQATMGAIFRIQIIYNPLPEIIQKAKANRIPIFGTVLSGKNIYSHKLPKNALIVMGNESKGISDELRTQLDTEILIPSFPENSITMESLNVSVATALVCAEFRRQQLIP